MKYVMSITTDVCNTCIANMYGCDDGMLHPINSK